MVMRDPDDVALDEIANALDDHSAECRTAIPGGSIPAPRR